MKNRSSYIYVLLICSIQLLASVCFTSSTLNAGDDSLAYTLKPYFEYMLIHHEPRFDKIPEIQYCCQKRSEINQGSGWGVGVKYELALPHSAFLGLKLGYNSFSALMASSEWLQVRQGDAMELMQVRHHTNSDFLALFINPYLKLKLFYNISLFAGGYAAPFISKEYEVYEQIESPKGKVYVDTKTDTRNYQKAEYKGDKGLWGGLNFGISYDLYLLDNRLFISPELSYNMGMNNVVKNLDWEVNSLNFALNLGINFHKTNEYSDVRRVVYSFDTIYVNSKSYNEDFKIGQEIIDSSMIYKGFIRETIVNISRVDTVFRGKKYEINLNMNNQDLYVEIRKANQEFQNLDIVFFKNSTAELLDNYKQLKDKNEFVIDDLEANPISIHYNILNIIAYRLSNNNKKVDDKAGNIDDIKSNSKNIKANSRMNNNNWITLEGDVDSLNTKELIESRFDVIKKYFADVWGLDTQRIQTNITYFANKNTKNKNDLRFIEESNKIKIIPQQKFVFEPIKKNNFDEIKSFAPDKLEMKVAGIENLKLQEYQLLYYQGDSVLHQENGKEKKENFDLKLDEKLINSINLKQPIEVTYIANLGEGKKITGNDSIKINRKLLNEKVSRLALIFFEFDSDKILNNSLAQINELTKYVTKKSRIRIKGYTDNIGTPEYNAKLSLNRAKNAANIILKYHPEANIESIEGFGSDAFTNGIASFDTPVERYLSRTVVIEIFDELY